MGVTLVTFLGRGRAEGNAGYREATYRFPDGSQTVTAFFGLALGMHLQVDTLVVLGTSGSQWSLLPRNMAGAGSEDELVARTARAEKTERVGQELLDDIGARIGGALRPDIRLRLIPFGDSGDGQYGILDTVAGAVPAGAVHIDVTHGFRHLGMVGLACASMLERLRSDLAVECLWYGALDMTRDGTTPVLRLDGLVRVQQWVNALERFSATGDYGVFAPLLVADGVAERHAGHLRSAAFHERNFDVASAGRELKAFLGVLEAPLQGASRLFRDTLRERVAWADLADTGMRQSVLAWEYLRRGDFVRAAIFAWEGVVTAWCEHHGFRSDDFADNDYGRKAGMEHMRTEVKRLPTGAPFGKAYRTLNTLRNALAHGSRNRRSRYARLLADEAQLRKALEACFENMGLEQEMHTSALGGRSD